MLNLDGDEDSDKTSTLRRSNIYFPVDADAATKVREVKDRTELPQTQWPKYVAFVCIIFHQTLAVFTMRYSQTVRTAAGRPGYLSTTTVFAAEVLKFVGSYVLVVIEEGGFVRAIRLSSSMIVDSPWDMLKMTVPALLYALQNNFLFIATANLSAAVYTGTYQIKTLTSALFSVLLLGKHLNRSQWIALAILALGVALLQLPTADTKADSAGSTALPSKMVVGSPAVGLAAVLGASLSSGFCGVYMEKLLKQTSASLWMKNLQLAFVGAPVSLIGALWCDFEKIQEGGLLQGYDALVWGVVCINALGGFAIAAVLRYADNIIKCFATAAAVLVSCVLSAAMGEFMFSLAFGIGACLVVAASLLYGLGPGFLHGFAGRKFRVLVMLGSFALIYNFISLDTLDPFAFLSP